MGIFDALFGRGAPPKPPPEETEGARRVRESLRAVRDPELDMDIVKMGLVRAVALDGSKARVRMTLSTAGCPYGPFLVEEVERVLREQALEPIVEVELDPPWSPEDIEQ
ncbi:MAG: metal-sulfur cluster assembly factor [Myxococcota bacterium]